LILIRKLSTGFSQVEAQQFLSNDVQDESILTWCTVNAEEQQKCESIAEYLKSSTLPYAGYQGRPDNFQLQCKQVGSEDPKERLKPNFAAIKFLIRILRRTIRMRAW